MKLSEEILDGMNKIKDAKDIYINKKQVLEDALNKVTKPIYKKQELLLKKFKTYIHSIIEQEHKCCHCSPRYYNEFWFTEDGITAYIDADHPNDMIYTNWTWDEIEEIFKNIKS